MDLEVKGSWGFVDRAHLSGRNPVVSIPGGSAARLEHRAMVLPRVASLYDWEWGHVLREAFARPSINELSLRMKGSGEAPLKEMLAKSTEADIPRKWFEPGACFAAGTLVHTKEGAVPIEKIKAGDWVLSKQENGGKQAYKRVLKTFAYPPETIMEVGYLNPDFDGLRGAQRVIPVERIISTLNHPFWVAEAGWLLPEDTGWTAADRLVKGFSPDGSKLEIADGRRVSVCGSGSIYVSDQVNIGWTPGNMGSILLPGTLWDYANQKLVASGVPAIRELYDFSEEYNHPAYEVPEKFLLKLPVFNLEVEDFHTYYVGRHGVWVHNQNCGGPLFEVSPTPCSTAFQSVARAAVFGA